MKIGILGGSFDPPHFGHLLIAQQIVELTEIDQIWFMPIYSTASHHKVFKKSLSSTKERLEMTRLLENEKIKISDFEINQNKKSLTINTLQILSDHYPNDTFYWIIGSDRLESFHLWDDWQEIISKFHLIIFPREHMLKELKKRVKKSFLLQTLPENVIVLDNKTLILTNISSTNVRERVKKGLPIDFLVPANVENYIKKHKLYEK
jgi:nicotinate-nucleotide adenylyltransferase